MVIDPFTVGGYRRTIVIRPGEGRSIAALEDDYHAMAVTLRHDGTTICGLDAEMARVPWTPCPGASAVIERTFVGVGLDGAVKRGDKRANCTHLYDLVLLAAAHAHDGRDTAYTIAVSDPRDGEVHAQIRKDGAPLLTFVHTRDLLSWPVAVAGRTLFELRDWIAALPDPALQEAARLLQWATIIAHGRLLTMEQHADISGTPTSCYTFQPERRGAAVRHIETIRDFGAGGPSPLDGFDGARFAS